MVKEMKRKAAYNDGWASKARSAEHRLERFETREKPPEKAATQDVKMRLGGGRTGKVVFRARGLSIRGIAGTLRRRGAIRGTTGRDRAERDGQDAPHPPARR